jgi:hypothetical protein
MPTGYAFSAAATIPFGNIMTGFNAGMETSLDGSINKLVLSGKAAFPVKPDLTAGLSVSYEGDKSTMSATSVAGFRIDYKAGVQKIIYGSGEIDSTGKLKFNIGARW